MIKYNMVSHFHRNYKSKACNSKLGSDFWNVTNPNEQNKKNKLCYISSWISLLYIRIRVNLELSGIHISYMVIKKISIWLKVQILKPKNSQITVCNKY